MAFFSQVLSKIIGIGVSDSTVGPGVMEIITSLLRNLERSVRNSPPGEDQSASSPILALQVSADLLSVIGMDSFVNRSLDG